MKNASYVILDGDGYDRIEVDTTSGDITITLPTRADNLGRRIEIANVKGGTNKVIIDADGGESKITSDGLAAIWLPKIDDYIVLQESATSGFWEVVGERITSQIVLNTYAGYGSTDNKIMRFTNSVENIGNMFSENHSTGYSSNTKGLEIIINRSGRYAITFAVNTGYGVAGGMCISVNSSSLTTNASSLSASERRGFIGWNLSAEPTLFPETVSICLYFKKGDILRPHTSGNSCYANYAIFEISYLG